jgi:molecular chaperone DnaJ
MAVRADWVEKDFYAVLGVAQDANGKAITRAYRKLARELHPDTHPDDTVAAERFKEVTAAYDVVGDTDKRAEYDEVRRAMAAGGAARGNGGGFGGGFDPGDGQSFTWFSTGHSGRAWTAFEDGDLDSLLGGLFGRAGGDRGDRPARGADLEAVLDLSFEDAVRGLTTSLTFSDGAAARTFKVRVPAGVVDGQRIRLAGKGRPSANGGPSGDLYAVVRVAPHPVFGRSGRDLTVEAPIGWPEAVLGTELDVPTLDGTTVRVRVPAGTPHGRVLRVRGRGVPGGSEAAGTGGSAGSPGSAGDLLVGIRVTVPDQLNDAQRAAVEAVEAALQAA